MLPKSIRDRFARPGEIEEEFINYLKEGGYSIDNDKTIAPISYYHQVFVDGQRQYNFFTGQFVQENTNVVDFVRPQSEHAVIYGIRWWVGDGGDPAPNQQFYTPGVGGNISFANTVFTITINSGVKIDNYPMNEALSDLTTDRQGLILLDEPIIWPGQNKLQVTCEDKSVTPTSFNFAVRCELLGIGLI